ARPARAAAVLRLLGDVGGGAAAGGGLGEAVGRAGGPRPGAVLRDVASPPPGPAPRGRRLGRIREAFPSRSAAPRGRGAAARRRVTVAGRGAALDAGSRDGVRRAVVVHAVAALRDVAIARRRAADGSALRIGRAIGARPGAVLRRVAVAERGAALDVRRIE